MQPSVITSDEILSIASGRGRIPEVAESRTRYNEIKSTTHLLDKVSSTALYEAGKLITEIRVSLTDIDVLKCPKIRGKCVTSLKKLFGKHGYMRKSVFECRDKQLFSCCLKGVKDKHELHKNRVMGMKIINDMIARASPSYITAPHVVNLIWSCMSCIHHFQLRIRTDSRGIVRRVREKTVEECLRTYSKLIRMFNPDLHRVVLSAILTFYRGGKMWEFEFACTDLVLDLLSIHLNIDQAINYMFDASIETAKENLTEARFMIQILYDVLRKLTFYHISNEIMYKLISAFESSICAKSTDIIDYVPLRKSLELCIKNAIDTFGNRKLMEVMELCLARMYTREVTEEQEIIEIGNIAVYSAGKYKVRTFLDSISQDFLRMLGNLPESDSHIELIISIRIWKNLMDRSKNDKIFKTPRIFFQDCDYQITLRKCSRSDKQFFKALRHMMYELILYGFIVADTKANLELLYQLIALTIVEIPCGYTASTNIAVIMHLQDYAFKISSTNLIKAHHLHAIVLSVMSLVCYVYRANVLYKYVNDIMDRRAEWAPQLSPPILQQYEYAVHHILWNKPNLFFQDWEAGYGLWKCFREKKKPKK